MLDIKRREFITLIGGGCLLLAVKVERAWGQQPAMPVIGFMNAGSPETRASQWAAFRQGLRENRLHRGSKRQDRIPLG
jgi:putative tryptophan/tyrosine transport system substrate-binding protein